jgi:alpha-beta hydrolase superfamily lysophospholipase
VQARWKPHKWRRIMVLVVLLAVAGLNAIAYRQAYAMTHYAAGGPATARPGVIGGLAKVEAVVAGVNVPRPANMHTPREWGLAYETRRIDVTSDESLEAWFVPQAQARGIVLLFPGYATSKESLLAPAAAFHALGYADLLVDFRGAGGSSGSATTLGVREGTDVAQAMAYPRATWPDLSIVLYGMSMGSAAVLRAVAHEGVQPAAVILESPFDRLLHTVGNRFAVMGLPAFPAADVLVFWGSVQQGFDGFADNPADDAGAVTCPALVLYGQGDPLAPPAEAQAVFTHLQGRKQIAGLPSTGHELLLNAAPDSWKQAVTGFLAGVQ